MDNSINLHIKRLREGLEQINSFRHGDENAWSPKFTTWRQRIQQSLKELFEESHDYYLRLKRLKFCNMKITFGEAARWSNDDQQLFEDGLAIAESIISDAIEELDIEPPTAAKPPTVSTRPKASTHIYVNVNNVLSQTTEVKLSQIMNSLDDLNLPAEKLKEAEKLAKKLEAESKGRKRWSVLAKSLDVLKGMGKPVYERIAIPLLLEMLKKQAGL